MSTDARRLIAQHAKTAQLMGVDFLPLGAVPAPIVQDKPAYQKNIEPDESDANGARAASSPNFVDDASPKAHPIAAADLRKAYEQLDDPQDRLDALRSKYQLDAPHQHFNTQFTNIVFGEGNPAAELMFVGEAPGEDEDQTGRPFVGRAGQLLEKMIQAMGFTRESVYITNVLKTRPTGNATPTNNESALCAPYLMEQIRIISPNVVVSLGLPASHVLLGITSPMRSMRGHWHTLAPSFLAADIPDVQIMPTYHPAYLLRSYTQDNRQKVWSDLSQVIEKLGNPSE